MDYSWKKPASYLVLVPGMPLILQSIQFNKVLPLTKFDIQSDTGRYQRNQDKFLKICKWNGRGSMISTFVCVVAVKALALPIFALLALLSVASFAYTTIKMIKTPISTSKYIPTHDDTNNSWKTTTEIETKSSLPELFFSI